MESMHTNIVYLCDGKACGDNHECMECKHTTDISHAVNFEKLDNNHWFEKEQQVPKNVLVVQVYTNLTSSNLKRFQENLCKMKESGVVVLPRWCELVEVVDDGTDIMVKEKK